MTVEEEITAQLAKQSGWCGVEKGIALCKIVQDTKPEFIVDVGVFSGKSTLSMAYGCRQNNSGIVIAVDSWAKSHCPFDNDPRDVQWWDEHVVLSDVYAEFLKHLVDTGLSKWVRILQMTSYQAARVVDESLGVLHVDGAHDEWSSTSDVCMWLPKVKVGGFVCLDDTNWESVKTAVRFTLKCCQEVQTIQTAESFSTIYQKIK